MPCTSSLLQEKQRECPPTTPQESLLLGRVQAPSPIWVVGFSLLRGPRGLGPLSAPGARGWGGQEVETSRAGGTMGSLVWALLVGREGWGNGKGEQTL